MADASSAPSATPEVEPITSLLSHALLQDPVFLAAAGGLLLILALFSVFRPATSAARSKGTPTAVLVGPPDSGKTSLFAALAHQARPATHTSLAGARTTFALSQPSAPGTRALTLVDAPGHPRLRDSLRAVVADTTVFVVDAAAVVRTASGVAEQLAPVLALLAGRAARSGRTQRLLVLAHKADLVGAPAAGAAGAAGAGAGERLSAAAGARAVERVRAALTRELDRLKAARGGGGIGGRIEGMARVASGAGWWARLFGRGAAGAGGDGGDGEAEAEEDEAAVWGGKGAWRWGDVEGVEVGWAASALGPAGQDEGNGLDALREYLWDL